MCFTPYGLYSPWRDGEFSSHMIIGFMLPFWVHVQVCMQGECTGCTSTHNQKKLMLRNIQKRKKSSAQICWQKRMHIPLRYNKIKMKKVREMKKIVNLWKGIKQRKKERKKKDSCLLEIEIIK